MEKSAVRFGQPIDNWTENGVHLSMIDTPRIWGTLDPFIEAGPVLGRKVANRSFLDALLSADPYDEYHFFLGDRLVGDALKAHVQSQFPQLIDDGRVRVFDRRELPGQMERYAYHCFHLSDCITNQPQLAQLRNRYSREIFPITGPIHSLSDSHFGGAFLRHLWRGATDRDAIVCSSSLGQRTVEQYFSWLRESYAMGPDINEPLLAPIPLAVDTLSMKPQAKIATGPVNILVFGRISHHSKMDLLPLVRALHRLVLDGLDPAQVELTLAGWVEDGDDFLPILTDLVANVGIALTIQARPSEEVKNALFQNADIFVSIADNPQETFGITLVEAGAYGLPVVASEYDGYRDIIEHERTGLLVPTIGPEQTPDVDALAPLLFDNQYLLLLSQRTVVEIPALAACLLRLISSPELRRDMGDAARERVETMFSWESVIQQHVALWDSLWENPVDPDPLRQMNHPQAMPYGPLFSHFTSQTMGSEILVKAGRTGESFYRGRDYPMLYSGLSEFIDPDIAKKLVFLARKSVDTGTLIRKLIDLEPQLDALVAENHVLWALKHDILERVTDR